MPSLPGLPNNVGDGVYKVATWLLSSIILTGLGSWFAFGQKEQGVQRGEMVRYVDNESLYPKDRALILDSIASSKALTIQVNALALESAKLSVKVDQVLDEMQGRNKRPW